MEILQDPQVILAGATTLQALHGEQSYVRAELASLPTPDGELYALTFFDQLIPFDFRDHAFDPYAPLPNLTYLRANARAALHSPEAARARALGFACFRAQGDREGQPVDITLFPSADYLNHAMTMLYEDSDKQPAFKFEQDKQYPGRIPSDVFISKLADGIIPLASPEHPFWLAHDIGDHVNGYTKLSAAIGRLIRQRAQTLVDKDKTELDEKGDLVDKRAKLFLHGIDEMSGSLAKPAARIHGRNARFIGYDIGDIMGRSLPVLKTARTQALLRNLSWHQRQIRAQDEILRAA